MGKTFQDLLNNGQARVLGIVSPVPMGNWLSTTQYQKLNLVRHNTATYIARTSNQNIEPGVADNWATYWMLICIDGGQVSPDGEYPEMSVGSVMHALLWGNKSYDGSSTQTITAADLGLADVYKPQGSVTFANLPATPNESNYGYVWNITNDFTTDSRFIEGAGKKYSAGTNVGVINQDGQYYYDILGNFVDLSNYAKIDGNYQEMTVGAVLATQLTNQDIHDFQGPEYWGKTYYGAGRNSVLNKPEGVDGFYLEVLRGGTSSTIHRLIATADTSGESVSPNIYIEQYVTSWSSWEEVATSDGSYPTLGAGTAKVAAKVENALTIIKDGVSTVYDGSEAKTVEITENGGITVIEIPANESDTLTSEQLQQVKNNPQNTVLRRTVSPEMNEIYCFDSVSMTQGADSAYTFRNVTSMAQNSLTLQAISVNLSSGLWVYSSVQTSAGGGGGSGITIVTIPQDGVSTNPVMSGTIELASPENTVIKIYNGEDNDGARYTYSILTSFDENASGDVPEYVYSGEDYIVTCTKSNGNTYNYTLTETPTPSGGSGGGTQLYRHSFTVGNRAYNIISTNGDDWGENYEKFTQDTFISGSFSVTLPGEAASTYPILGINLGDSIYIMYAAHNNSGGIVSSISYSSISVGFSDNVTPL